MPESDRPIQLVLSRLEAKATGERQWQARCPAHEDRQPSLSIAEGDDATVLLTCHAGCSARAIVEAMGLTLRDLFASNNGNGKPKYYFTTPQDALAALEKKLGSRTAAWTYRNAAGSPVQVVARWDSPTGKQYRPVSLNGSGWLIGAARPSPLYRLPELTGQGTVFVCEGEKTGDAAAALGLVATTSAGGCKAQAKTDWTPLAGRPVVLLPDNDAPGRVYAQLVSETLLRLTPPATVKVLELPGLPEAGDIVEFIQMRRDEGKDDGAIRLEIEDLAAGRPLVRQPGGLAEREGHDHADLLSDIGNGKRLVAAYGGDLRYCRPWRKWLCWDSNRWKVDDVGRVETLAKATTLAIYDQAVAELAAHPDNPKELVQVLKFALASQQAQRVQAMITMAQSEGDIPIVPGMLDTDNWSLNVINGTIDLRTGTVREHRRQDAITKLCPVRFNPEARCPAWEAFLRRIMDGNDGLQSYLQRAIGYSLTGDVREQCLFFLHGTGSNGKSTFIGAILGALGDYAMQGVSELLTVRHNEAHPTERKDLFGKRFVALIETEDGKRMAEALVKQLTGGDRIRARGMREDFWEFAPTHKLFLAANHKPVIRGRDHAIWRRIRLIPFTVKIEGEEKDKDLPAKLAAEAEGILAWAVRGSLEWQRDGLHDPTEVVNATEGYRAEQDTLTDFFVDCCILSSECRDKSSTLYTTYQAWAKRNGEADIGRRHFGQELESRGFQRYMNNGTWYRGLAVRNEFTEARNQTEPLSG